MKYVSLLLFLFSLFTIYYVACKLLYYHLLLEDKAFREKDISFKEFFLKYPKSSGGNMHPGAFPFPYDRSDFRDEYRIRLVKIRNLYSGAFMLVLAVIFLLFYLMVKM